MPKIILFTIALLLFTSNLFAQEKKIGIALGGGAALGYAHIGVLQALEDYGIQPTHIAGTSMGSIVGAFYAAGYSPDTILQLVQEKKLYRVDKVISLQPVLLNSGMSTHSTLISVINDLIPHNSFDSLKYDFTSCATNLDLGCYEYTDSGNNLDVVVAASSSIPGVFETQVIDDVNYVDGGLLNNMPAEALHQKGCDYIIGVDVLPFIKNALHENKKETIDLSILPFIDDNKSANAIDVLMWSIRLVQYENSKKGRSYCDWVIESHALIEYHEFDFNKFIEIYQYGYYATVKYIEEHPELKALGMGIVEN